MFSDFLSTTAANSAHSAGELLRLTVFRDPSVQITLLVKRQAEIVVRRAVVGVQAQGLALLPDGPAQIALSVERQAQSFMREIILPYADVGIRQNDY